jgi:hypothetical protein
MLPLYPADQVDDLQQLKNMLGTFWPLMFNDQSGLDAWVAALSASSRQAAMDLTEMREAISRATVPLRRTERWFPFTWTVQQLVPLVELHQYLDLSEFTFSDNSLLFGVGVDQGMVCLPVATSFDVVLLAEQITQPGRWLIRGLDFFQLPGWLVFRESPLIGDQFTWFGFYVQEDKQRLQQQFGYALPLSLPSTDTARRFLNAIMDAYVRGASISSFARAWYALTDTPYTETTETVEEVTVDVHGRLIITDREAYRVPDTADIVVNVGDRLRPLTPLTASCRIYDLGHGELPDYFGLTLGRGFLPIGLRELTFDNRDVPLVVETVDGYTKVSFELGGFPEDVTAFWELTHQQGVQSGNTLAHSLDVRDNPSGEPVADNLPATVNPYALLCTGIMRNHLYLVSVRPIQQGPQRLPMLWSILLSQVIPPHTHWIASFTLDQQEPTVIMDGTGDSEREGYVEEIAVLPVVYEIEAVPAELVGESIAVNPVTGTCET